MPFSRTWIPVAFVFTFTLLLGYFLGKYRHLPPKDIRQGTVRLDPQAEELLKTVPTRNGGNVGLPSVGVDNVSYTFLPRTYRYPIYGFEPPNNTLTPTSAYKAPAGLITHGTVYEFTGEPTNGYPAGGYIWLEGGDLKQSLSPHSFVAVSLGQVPSGQQYLVDFTASAVNDGTHNKGCQWTIDTYVGNPITTPCAASNPNAMQEQHLYAVVISTGGYFTEAGLSMQSAEGTAQSWTFTSATLTRVH